MKLLSALMLSAAVLAAPHALAQDAKDVAAAADAAQQWLALVDSKQYAQTWSAAAPAFQQAVKQADWEQAVGAVRAPLGALASRTVTSARFTRELPNAPKGDYVVITYASAFANQANAVETVTPMRDADGKWKVSGYFVR